MKPASNDYQTKKPSYMPWNEDAFWGDMGVRAMTALQCWIYRTLLQTSFFCATRPYLPNNNNQLWVLAGCVDKQQWMENKRPVMAMFTRETVDGHRLLFRKRVLEDWQRLLNKRKELHERGKRGGLASAGVRAQLKLNPGSPELDNNSTKIEVEIEEEEEIEEESEVKGDVNKEKEEKLSLEKSGQECKNTSVSDFGIETVVEPKSAGEMNLASIPTTGRSSPAILSSDAGKVIAEITYLSRGRVVPDNKQSVIITNWLTDHTADEIIAAFDDFFAQMGCNEYGVENEFEIRHAARNFCEKGLHLIEYARRQEKEDAEREEELAARKRVEQLMQETQKPQADAPDTN